MARTIESNPNEGRKLKSAGNLEAGRIPTEFGGLPGFYGNVLIDNVVAETTAYGLPYDKVDPEHPDKARTALTQTDSTDATAQPVYGNGGDRVA